MRYTLLPGTGLELSALSLGTMTFGGQTGEKDSLAILDAAFAHGVNFWDTANTYNAGQSERIVGQALKGRRDDIFLATKVFGVVEDRRNARGLSRRAILQAAEASLRRLDTDYIDLYYLHSPDYLTNIHETLDTMDGLVRQGKVRYIGVSNYAAWQVADILAICERYNYTKPVYSQNIFNLLTRGAQTELLPFLNAHNLGMAVYNPIAAGLLTGKHRPGDPSANTRFALNPNYYKRYWNEENFRAVERLQDIARAAGMGLLEMSLKWCLQQPGVKTIISGVSRLGQLLENLEAIEGQPLSPETMEQCDAVWQGLSIGSRFPYNR